MKRRINTTAVFILLLFLFACSSSHEEPNNKPLTFSASGYYRVEQTDTRWWLVDPQGKPFYSIGLNHISSGGYTDKESGQCPYCESIESKYGDKQVWRTATVDRMVAWGFNTVGAWSDREGFDDRVAQTPVLHMNGGVVDFFSEELEQRAASEVAKKVAPYREDPAILGWFLDNEMDWGADWRSPRPQLEDYLELAPESPGRQVAERYRDDPRGFLSALAHRYFEVTTRAVREADPNHLILGVRASTIATPPEVVQAAAAWIDVFSINHYDLPRGVDVGVYNAFDSTPTDGWLHRYHELSGLPLMITEFTYRSSESDVPNSYPPIYYTFDTQRERADAYHRFAQRSFDAHYIVGHHWFEYYDDPPGGRSDGEDSNFGLVSNADEPYLDMTEQMTQSHEHAPHQPLGMQRELLRSYQQESTVLRQGESYGDHYIHNIELYPSAAVGRYTFTVLDPAPENGMAVVMLQRDGVALDIAVSYPNDFHLPPLEEPVTAYTFNFPGFFKIEIAGRPETHYRYISLFNVYRTVFDGVRVLPVR